MSVTITKLSTSFVAEIPNTRKFKLLISKCLRWPHIKMHESWDMVQVIFDISTLQTFDSKLKKYRYPYVENEFLVVFYVDKKRIFIETAFDLSSEYDTEIAELVSMLKQNRASVFYREKF